VQSPNILLITVDDMNYNSPGVSGCGVDGITPNIDRLAAEGIRFVHSHVTIAVCQPSRSVLMTGKYPHSNGAMGFEPIRQAVVTLQELLNEAGYLNGIIGKENHLAPREKFRWNMCVRTLVEGYGFGRDPAVYYEHSAGFIAEARRQGKPFFLMANVNDPHRPFAGSGSERKLWGCNTAVRRVFHPDEVQVPGFLPDLPDVRKEIAQYYTSVYRADETVGEIVRALKESGEEENTMVLFLSDNGMAFPFAKTNCYLNSTRTPWIVRWPGRVKAGAVDSTHFISGIDFMPTVLEAAGLAPATQMDGKSFLPLLIGEDQGDRTRVYTVFNKTIKGEEYPIRCVQNAKYGYIYNAWSNGETVFHNESQSGLTFKAMVSGAKLDKDIEERVRLFEYRVKEELYDFELDPDALCNLADNPDYRSVLAGLRQEMAEQMAACLDPLEPQFKSEMMK
jgi:N-sulfoglucosamine sulfohydrolase